MDDRRWLTRFAVTLVVLSALIYMARWLVFGQADEMLRYLVDDLAFIPMQVLLVTLVLDSLLARRERDALLHKLNMVVGAFFSELGTPLIARLMSFDVEACGVKSGLLFRVGWGPKDFADARRKLAASASRMDAEAGDIDALRDLLVSERQFTLALLQNPNLLEHGPFSELLWAVLHLEEELVVRPSLHGLPRADADHLAGDMDRAYRALLREWLAYVEHLSRDYPYLYSLAVRQNPFDDAACVTVGG